MPLLVYAMIGFGGFAFWGTWTNLHGTSNELAAGWQGLVVGLLMKTSIGSYIPFEWVYYFPPIAILSLGLLLFCRFTYRGWLDKRSSVDYKPSPWTGEQPQKAAVPLRKNNVIRINQ